MIRDDINGGGGGGGVVGTECDGGATGGHYDPTYACRPASDFAGAVCGALANKHPRKGPPPYSYSDECTLETPSACELGDISGKAGQVNPYITDKQEFENKNLEALSTGFQCGSPRVACANLAKCIGDWH